MGLLFAHPLSEYERDHPGLMLATRAYVASHDGALPGGPTTAMWEHRWALNPTRFAFYHPNIAEWLRDAGSPGPPAAPLPPRGWTGHMRQGPTPAPCTPACPPIVEPCPPTWDCRVVAPCPPPDAPRGAVPEPAGLIGLATALCLGLALLRRRA